MNKNSYRIIYSKARQMFVAVAENVRSQTKASGQSEASAQSNIDNTESLMGKQHVILAVIFKLVWWV
nr:ESPR domain-containing protein [Acinetobacter pittii]